MLRVRALLLLFATAATACGGSSFDIAAEEGQDTGASDTATGTSDGASDGAPDGTSSDTGNGGDGGIGPDADPGDSTVSIDAACAAISGDAADVFVDGSVGASGTGAASCPVKTIREGLALPRNPGVKRIVHVKAGSYVESDLVGLGGSVVVVSEGGRSMLSGGSKSSCVPAPDKCIVRIEGAATLDGFDVDASPVGNGIVVAGGAAVVKNTKVKNAMKDGLVIFGGTPVLGPAVSIDENGNAGVVVRNNGVLKVTGGGNTFDNNKGKGFWSGSTYVAAAGILLYGGALLDFEGGSASGNQVGVLFDWSSSTSTAHKISNLVAKNNRSGGLMVPHNTKSVVVRNSTFTKNATYGAWFEYDASASNVFDLGTLTSPGNNVFGGTGEKNGKLGIFLCRPPNGGQDVEANSWGKCPPSQTQVSNCDALPPSYADVAYVLRSGISLPIGSGAANVSSCATGP